MKRICKCLFILLVLLTAVSAAAGPAWAAGEPEETPPAEAQTPRESAGPEEGG